MCACDYEIHLSNTLFLSFPFPFPRPHIHIHILSSRRAGLANGILYTHLVHLIGVEGIEVDAVHQIHEAIGGVLLRHAVDLLEERYQQLGKFQIKAPNPLRKRICRIQRGLNLAGDKEITS